MALGPVVQEHDRREEPVDDAATKPGCGGVGVGPAPESPNPPEGVPSSTDSGDEGKTNFASEASHENHVEVQALRQELKLERRRTIQAAEAGQSLLAKVELLSTEVGGLRSATCDRGRDSIAVQELLRQNQQLEDEVARLRQPNGNTVGAAFENSAELDDNDGDAAHVLEHRVLRKSTLLRNTFDEAATDLEERLREEGRQRRLLEDEISRLQADCLRSKSDRDQVREAALGLQAQLDALNTKAASASPRTTPRNTSQRASRVLARRSLAEAQDMHEAQDSLEALIADNLDLKRKLHDSQTRCDTLEDDSKNAGNHVKLQEAEAQHLRSQLQEMQRLLDDTRRHNSASSLHREIAQEAPAHNSRAHVRGSAFFELHQGDCGGVNPCLGITDSSRGLCGKDPLLSADVPSSSGLAPFEVEEAPKQDQMRASGSGSVVCARDAQVLCQCPCVCMRFCMFSRERQATLPPEFERPASVAAAAAG